MNLFLPEFPVYQAALSGYSDAPMRRIAKRFGASMTLCEVFLDRFVMEVSKHNKARLYLTVQESDHPCGAQLMGSDPEEFVPAAKRLVEYGFDLIDLNFACPVKKVIGKSRGGYLMTDIPRALEIAEQVRYTIPSTIPMTVKLRRGYDDSPKSEEEFYHLLDGLLNCGISALTLHGRTVLQRYEGYADWNFIREVKRYLVEEKHRPDIPLFGSGDLFTAEESLRKMQTSGVDGLALARGIIGNPWLFGELKALWQGTPLPVPPTLLEQKEVIADHYRQVEELYGEKRATTVMRKFGIRYAVRHPENEKLRRAFVTCKTGKRWYEILDEFYGK